ncbi:MAG: flagellar motor protein MotB [Anaerohalosphaeraceae bacterium]
MAREKKTVDDGGGESVPEWMLTFSDCMTLLLTFFVLLMSFASFDKDTIPELGQAFARAFPGVGLFGGSVEKSMMEKNQSPTAQMQKEGSETRTLADAMSSNFMKEKKPLDFRNLKVFSIESEKVFWGNGIALTDSGKDVLKALEKFLLNTPGRIVISENGPPKDTKIGLDRAMMVMDYLAAGGIDKKRMSISASPTTADPITVRQLEITLLERSVYE